ncbi:hypothetical protein GSI_06573 [Ganoderma sinense ZZ0214-1]|uniref:Uncharacterized protein n=1 Tax=Ganoderma sinense ZZ0214-1 TaxID=1077348 RepID=A0A2G8SDN7_9APHY|nr:hypothetical protein GSI_06573 [Ganoderma sinense ZZ0214-1]
MPRLTRIRRLIGVLQQMIDTVRARTVPNAELPRDDDILSVHRQRLHVEWLCDHDINAFRVYARAEMTTTRVVPLSGIPHSLTWGYVNDDPDNLYYGSEPFVFYFPAKVTHIALEDQGGDEHRLELHLEPLALQDIVALDFLAAFANPINTDFPRSVKLTRTLTMDDELAITDSAVAFSDDLVNWSDVLVDDYLLAEVLPALMTPHQDPILRGDDNRFVLFPIRHPVLWQMYKHSQRSYWTTEEIDLSQDLSDWMDKLVDAERELLSVILAFFASSDGIVGENLVQQFSAEVSAPEARCFYGFQIMMENVHAEMYALLLQELIVDPGELARLFGAAATIPTVRAKADWCLKWFDRSTMSFGHRLVAFAIVEGVFFSSSFAAIFWVKSRGMLPGLCHSNELIMRDEGQHVEFACALYGLLNEKLPIGVIHAMLLEAVALEKAFFQSALPKALRGLNAVLMDQYVEYVADFLLWRLCVPLLFGQTNPFPFMEGTAIPGRANFFERGVSDYQGAAVSGGSSHMGMD